ncbi:MAG: NADPH-dependent oxidoreductase [Bacteroidetes bacterium]|jgi:NAD(P)H-dependent FMN reductase|nr:NADPH-dependent oxidoreductase [Bacteroidota bacterium]
MTTKDTITIISGTNRAHSNTRLFTEALFKYIKASTNAKLEILDLCELEGVDIENGMFNPEHQHPKIVQLQNEFIIPAQKFIFVIPEYNGSYPGILKYFIDACSVREYQANFLDKRAFLIGISTGRAGNLRGLDHLTSVLNYLHTHVHPLRLPISKVTSIFDRENVEIKDPELLELLDKHLVPFVSNPVPYSKSQLS